MHKTHHFDIKNQKISGGGPNPTLGGEDDTPPYTPPSQRQQRLELDAFGVSCPLKLTRGYAPGDGDCGSCRRCYRWTVDPSSDLYYRWLAVITLAVVYNLTIIVARTVLPDLQDAYRAVWITLDYVCDLAYVVDTLVRFRTSKFHVDVGNQRKVSSTPHPARHGTVRHGAASRRMRCRTVPRSVPDPM